MREGGPTVNDGSCSSESPIGQMFDRIAPTYDLLNYILSFGRDYSWRRKVAGQIGRQLPVKVLDLATGTGDLLIALLRACPNIAEAAGLDISENMLGICREKLRRRGLADRARLVCADASATPFPEGTFDVVTMGFGIRNTPDVSATLREIHRVLKPGGVATILEFSLPRQRAVRWCYLKHLRYVVPFVGALISRDRHAYRYLDESIERFCSAEGLASCMRVAGFRDVSATPLTFGVASIYRGRKDPVCE